MKNKTGMLTLLTIGTLGGILALLNAQPRPAATVAIGASDLGGVVTSPSGPEAGVWVIAETSDLPTKYAKVVVTDDRGRYLIPDLPKATYTVWVRGYGLIDSPKVKAVPGEEFEFERSAGSRRRGRCGILSRRLLVFDDADSCRERIPRNGRKRQRHPGGDEDAALLDRYP